ncbi:MAG: hypothetical protein K2G40_02530, partial [Muribaculaceae bacterium]|nr:hypothetical protein [Muribaculaceae bacterium]
MPSIETCTYNVTGTIENIVSNVGEDLMINIGPLLGLPKYTHIDNSKPRDIDIWTSGPYSRRTTVKIQIPQGYSISPDILEQLYLNEITKCGSIVI